MCETIRIAQIMGKWHGGGVESVVMNYYRNIDRTKVQFDFICDSDSTLIPYEEIESLGGRVIIVPPYQKIFAYRKELIRVFRENNYHIVHSHINTLSVFPLSAAKKADIPVRIAHSHSSSNKKEWKKNILKQLLRPWSKFFANEYFCCSELAGRFQFGNRAYDRGQVFLLNNAIDLDRFRFSEEIRKAKRCELGINEDAFVVGHVGRFVTVKNQSFIIDVFSEILMKNPESMLIFAGKGPLENELKEKTMKLGIENKVRFLGQRSDIAELYQAFDCFVLPSLYEGLGVVLIEAQASGLKCFASSNVPMEAKISKDLTFISLDEGKTKWAEKILEIRSCNRIDNYEECTENGYNIKLNSSKLMEKYLSF